VGYAVSSAGIAELLNRMRQPFNVNSIAQAGALAALDEQAWVSESVARSRTERERIHAALEAAGISCLPSRANFLLAYLGPDAAECNEYLLRQGVIVRPVANYGLPEYLRISVGTESENNRLLEALAGFRSS
jgi:histidinol-phosphate aminotransferase